MRGEAESGSNLSVCAEIPEASSGVIQYPVSSVGPLMGDIRWARHSARPPGVRDSILGDRRGGDVEIHWTNLDGLEEKDRQGAEVRFRKLGASHNDLIDLRIPGKKNGHRAQSSEEVRIACQARGREIVAARSADQVGRALHDAMEAFEREVWRLRKRRRDRRSGRGRSEPESEAG
jgi:ribosome-associated translation inhibitor RaiA